MQHGFSSGEMSPRLFGRTDLAKYSLGCSTLRNHYVDYRGGASSRAGLAYVGMCKQAAPNAGGTTTNNPPRDIPFQFNISQGYALEFGDQYMRIKSNGAYVIESTKTITAATNANPAVFTSALHGYSDGDWIFDTGFSNMLNNVVFGPNSFTNSLTIIDQGITTSAPVGNSPEGVCISPDGLVAYVTNFTDNTVSVINTKALTTIATIPVGTDPRGIAITPNGTEVYVANYGSNNVSVIATISNTVISTIPVGANPSSVAILPNGVTAYVTNFGINTVTPITIASHAAGAPIVVGTDPYCASATPDSAHVYVTNNSTNNVSVIRTSDNTVTNTIAVGTSPIGIVVTPDGLHAYVANNGSSNVSVITIASNTVTSTITVGANPVAVSASSDSANVYVSIYSTATASVISTASNTIIDSLSTGSKVLSPQSLAVYSSIIQVKETDGFAVLNGLTWIVQNSAANTYTLTDLFGNVVDSTDFGTYIGGAQTARIYTVVSPYAAVDLPFLKFTQSADTMTLTCVNQETNTEYLSYELVRNGATNWVFTADSFASSITAPTGISVIANASTTLSTFYSYVVTAVDAITGEESVASAVGTVENNDIAINAGSNVITWAGVSGASNYNIYAATPSYAVAVPTGAAFGYIGSAFGTQFTDTNIIADFTVVPPVHNNPFARGAISSVTPTAIGSTYSQSDVGFTISTSTGSGAAIVPVVVNGGVVAYIIQNGGELYQAGDTITITGSHTIQATAVLNIGPESGTYPGTCAYFQQRRVYAFTLNQPDTYFMSQPGAYNNMDSSIPATDSDSITGAPWAQQINGIQFLVPMPGGLVILTGKGAWSLNGGTSAAITPADQTAVPQAYNGCHFHIPPIVVNYDILYVQAKGSIVRDLSYNFFVNIYTGTDMTVLSEHLFNFHQLQQWAYAEEPYKIIWAIRDDGIMLSLTYLKEQDVYGWARHDTNGLFMGVCSITEPPVDAVYGITRRYIQGESVWVYYSERMDNRNWQVVEDCFCVDAGLSLPMTFPDAILTPSLASGTNNISSTNIATGGSGYVAPVATPIDDAGAGSGASFSVTVVAGIITDVTPITQGQNYTLGSTRIVITDSVGSGAVVYPVITNIVNFSTDNSVFTNDMVGDVIRIGHNNAPLTGFVTAPNGGGKAIITSVFSGTNIAANIIEPITNVVPNDPENTPIPVNSNYWSLSTPVTNISGLNHLEGMAVSCLADGNVVDGLTVTNGSVTLPAPASAIVVGLPFTAQGQTLYLDAPSQQTMQGKRKNIQAVTSRVQNTRGLFIGSNQIDASTQPNNVAPAWTNMFEMKPRNTNNFPGTAVPLFSGDLRELIGGDWQKPGQIAWQVIDPLPCNLLALIPEFQTGDTAG